MKQKRRNNLRPIDPRNFFGFEDDDISVPTWNTSRSNSTADSSVAIEFRPDKPYRLALYVQPFVKRRRTHPSITSMLANKSVLPQQNKSTKPLATRNNNRMVAKETSILMNRKNENITQPKAATKTKGTKAKQANVKKTKNARTDTENQEPKPRLITRKINTRSANKQTEFNAFFESPVQKPTVFDEQEPLFSTKPSRRSYSKKEKEKEPLEPTTEQVLSELQTKRTTKTKARTKRPPKEEQEYEKWAESMNSAFQDVDKFELSINYD